MPIIMLLNLKGGVAKTTNAIAIAETFAKMGKKVLVIDADHQTMASELLLGQDYLLQIEEKNRTLHDLMSIMLDENFIPRYIDKFVIKNATLVHALSENMDCIPCSHRIDDFTTNIAKAKKGYQSNDKFMNQYKTRIITMKKWCNTNYAYTIIDCPPSLAIQVRFFLRCADYFILPCLPDRLSIRGSTNLLDRLKQYKIDCLGTLWSMVRGNVAKHQEIMNAAHDPTSEYSSVPKPFKTFIPNASAMVEAMDSSKQFSTYNMKYQQMAGKLYHALCEEIEERVMS